MSATMRRSVEPSVKPAGNSAYRRRWLLLVLAIVVILAGYAYYRLRTPPREQGMTALVKAYETRRLIEPRLSGGFLAGEYIPAPKNSDGSAASTDAVNLPGINGESLLEAHNLIVNAATNNEDTHALHAHGRLLLMENETSRAWNQLNTVVKRLPDDAEAHNDLGACLIERSNLEDAIEEFSRALEIKPRMPEALFNRALCYQRLLLSDAARADLSSLMEAERDAGWLNEVRSRYDEVSRGPAPLKLPSEVIGAFDSAVASGQQDEARRVADENYDIIRRHAITDLANEHLKTAMVGDKEASARALSKMELIGQLLIEAKGDRFISDAAAYFRELDDDKLQSEQKLMEEFNNALGVFRSRRFADAQPLFEQLRKPFRDRGNFVFEQVSAALAAQCYYVANRLTPSIKTLREIQPLVERQDWPFDRARTYGQLGIAYARLGQDSIGIKYCQQLLEIAGKIREFEAKGLQFISVPYWHLGDLGKALSCLHESTRIYLAKNPDPLELANNYLNIADIYRLRDKHTLAQLYAEKAVSFASQAKNNDLAAQASSFMAIEYAQLEQFDQAQASLERAFEYLNLIDYGPRLYTEPLVLTRAGEVALKRGKPADAIQYYTKAESLVGKAEEQVIPMIRVLSGRAEAYVALNQLKQAGSDLERAVSLIDENRAEIIGSHHRSVFLDLSHGVFDQLISLKVSGLGREVEAFDSSERARARALLDEQRTAKEADPRRRPRRGDPSLPRSEDTVPPLTLAQLQPKLPDDLTVAEYSVTNQRTYIFLVSRASFKVVESPVSAATLSRLVQDYLSDLKEMAALETIDQKARELYRHLIEPIEAHVGKDSKLCIVPDKSLHFLPFPALIDGSGRYLVESRTLTSEPSASILAHCIQADRDKPTVDQEKMLAVGSPEFSRTEFPDLQSLPDAEREAAQSVALYAPGSIALTRREATEARVCAAMKDYDVTHLALHCLVEEKLPWLAGLVLASASPPAPGGSSPASDDGVLYLDEIYNMRLPRTRLVVLSACRSALGQHYRGEGIVSLVRPFITVKVPMVVASLWPVDSGATADLMVEFHKQRKANRGKTGDALRDAQRVMARSALYNHPYYWAPFIAIGYNN